MLAYKVTYLYKGDVFDEYTVNAESEYEADGLAGRIFIAEYPHEDLEYFDVEISVENRTNVTI